MADQEPNPPRLFCTSQVLSLLHPPADQSTDVDVKKFLTGDRFWNERHRGRGGEELEKENPWRPIPRLDVEGKPGLLSRLSAGGDIQRLALVCTGGLGKSANLEYLAGMLKTVGLVPFHFVLDEKGQKLPDSAVTFWTKTLPEMFSRGKNSELAGDQPKARRILEKARASGRLALLFDSVDQATKNGLAVAEGILSDPAWSGCPVVITGRPHAIDQHWDLLIKPDVSAWHFLRVEPLAEEQRHLLLGPDGVDQAERRRVGKVRYEQLPASGQQLLENPRNIEYVRELAGRKPRTGKPKDEEPKSIAEFTLADIKTASHLFAGAVDNLVAAGFASGTARRLGKKLTDEDPDPKTVMPFQQPLAMNLLASLAYAMYCWPSPDGEEGDDFRPNVSHIPAERVRELLHGEDGDGGVLKLLADAKVPDRPRDIDSLEKSLTHLSALNAKLDFCLLDRSTDSGLRWHDRTLQEFLAAWWLSRHATGEDVERLRRWRYDNRMAEAKSLYSPLWGFLVEMPKAVRTAKWFTAVGVLFEHGVSRCCEMIYRCCQTFEGMRGEEKVVVDKLLDGWRREFAGMRGEVAEGLRTGMVRLECREGSRLPGDTGRFMMGSPEGEAERSHNEVSREERVKAFGIGVGPVTNEQYELFDSGQKSEREWKEQPDIACHPVVNVDWWEAWCFARWVGGRLPTEVEWEYACRGGTTTPFYWGATLNGTQANCNGNFPYPDGSEAGPYLRRTSAVGSYAEANPHPWRLVDVHGNVWEWCDTWYNSEHLFRVLRGGSWDGIAWSCRAADRGRIEPTYRLRYVGVRLVLPCT